MKQGTNFTLPVNIAMDLNLVDHIEFIFTQPRSLYVPNYSTAIKKFTYPSDTAVLSEDEENTVDLTWTIKDTYLFDTSKHICMDTRIWLVGTNENPETDIVSFKLSPTLFGK